VNQVQGNGAMKKRNLHSRLSAKQISAGVDLSVDDQLYLRRASPYTSHQQHVARSKASGTYNTEARRLLQVEIDSTTLLQLLKGRRLYASDIRCLDCESKRCLMRLLLRACAQDLDEEDPRDHQLITS
jgi:hypothetical protein